MLGSVCLTDLQGPGVVQTDAWETSVEKLAVSLSRSSACLLRIPSNQWAAYFAALQVLPKGLQEQSSVAGLKVTSGEAEEKPGSRAIHFRASSLPNTDSEIPNVLELMYGWLEASTRAVLHALCRSRLLRLRSDTFDSVLDDLPLARTQQGSSLLSIQTYMDNFQDSCTAQTGHIFMDPQEEMSDSGLLSIIVPEEAHDPDIGPLSVTQVKDAAGNWQEVQVKEGEAVVLLGRTIRHATAGILGPATYRVAGDPYGTKNGHSRRLLHFELRPRPSAVLDFTQQLADAGHQVSPKYAAPVSVRSLMQQFELLMSPGKDVHTPRNMEGVAAHTAWDLATAKKQRKRSSEAAGLLADDGDEAAPVTRSGNVRRTSTGGLVNQHRPSRFKQQATSAGAAAAAGRAGGSSSSGEAPMEGSAGDSGHGSGRLAGGAGSTQQHRQQPTTAGGAAGSGRGSLCDAMGRRRGLHDATGAARALYYVRGHTCTVLDGCLLDEPASCIALCVRSFTGLERWFYCNRSLACGRVFETYCDRMGINLGAVKFLYKGDRIYGADTPAGLQVEDGEEFTAVPESSDRLQQAQELGPLYATLFNIEAPGTNSPI